ncbi:lgl family protein [Schizosaccharomyces cryophilus OY26]|uniref:Lgl family protein n=1 Tax=Schizosaccharomyces cryophilus (strain OY26 / ATCC MYA-4695 / CBS 11777 / NBRC 106824 / NRRL Y48691) TaxID=653667 RepID=S9W6L9_SCHCR|nr:lgl family protein [Schizosaccharomyces cryophilus OY26]EPY54179.1 lgl family protein [Schizosaccharomyces cryophilus OY26]
MSFFKKFSRKKESPAFKPFQKASEKSDLTGDAFMVDDYNRFGFYGNPTKWCIDHQQGLLAIASTSRRIYIYGKLHTQLVIIPDCSDVLHLVMCAGHLIIIDSQNTILSYNLLRSKNLHTPTSTFYLRLRVMCTATDPSIEWVYLGMSDGTVIPWDVTRHRPGVYKIPNLYSQRLSEWKLMGYPYAPVSSRLSPVISIQIHPKDLGLLLVAYPEGVLLFSIRDEEVLRFYELEYAAGSTAATMSTKHSFRRPMVKGIHWSPCGEYFLSFYEDSAIAFWDTEKEIPVQVRNFVDSYIHTYTAMQKPAPKTDLEAIQSIIWCCREDANSTFLLMLGGLPKDSPVKGISMFSFPQTPGKQNFNALAEHFANPSSQRFFPFVDVPSAREMMVISTMSPYYNGTHNPRYLLMLSQTGTLSLVDLISSEPVNLNMCVPPSLCFLAPDFQLVDFQAVKKNIWDQMEDSIPLHPHYSSFSGGSPHPGYLKKLDVRNVLITSTGLSLSLWDISKGFMNPNICVTLDFSEVMRKHLTPSAKIVSTSLSPTNCELSCADNFGRVIICRLKDSLNPLPFQLASGIFRLDDSFAIDGTLYGQFCIDLKHGPVTTNCMSNIGFVCIGYADGSLAVVDLRGPHILCNTSLPELGIERKSKSSPTEYVNSAEFVIMNLNNDGTASIHLIAVTNTGIALSFQIGMSASGNYSITFLTYEKLGILNVYNIVPLTESGQLATATGTGLQSLGTQSDKIYLLYVGETGMRLYSRFSKCSSMTDWSKHTCYKASVIFSTASKQMGSVACIMSNLNIYWYSLPNLSEERRAKLPDDIDERKLRFGNILEDGDYVFPTVGGTELAFGCVLGMGRKMFASISCSLITKDPLTLPPRPTKSTWKWLMGEQTTSADELNLLLGGEYRTVGKPITESQAPRVPQHVSQQSSTVQGTSPNVHAREFDNRRLPQQKSYFSQMSEQLSERGKMLGNIESTMDDLEEMSADWLNEIKKSVASTKKDMLISGLKSYLP